jgi:uncharacterized protein (DUF1800 family)
MKAFKSGFRSSLIARARRAAALFSTLALLSGTFALGVGAQQSQPQKQRLGEDQRILHVLNRLGYGVRPGDVERVRALGLDNYIRQQLEPSKITDTLAEARVGNLTTLSLSTAELYAKYPQPGALLRQLERRGELPPELAALRDSRVKGKGAQPDAAAAAMTKPDGAAAMAMRDTTPEGAPPAADANGDGNQNEYRRAVREYLLKNGLQPPQRIVAELQASRILRAVYSERQLQEVLVDFWSNHFNVFAGKGADRWLLVSYDRDTIRPHTLGKFSDLLLATAQSPAMLFYLDNFQSVSPNASTARARMGQRPQGGLRALFLDQLMRGNAVARRGASNPNALGVEGTGMPAGNMPQSPAQKAAQQQRRPRGINENYARELMELHTLGVDGGYTQRDVQEVARCFTGWTIFAPRGLGNRGGGAMAASEPGKFYFNARLHDDGEKIVLGHKIPAGGGVKDGLLVLDILAHHPATAKFIATKLARRFVMDEPTPQLVERIAQAFTRSDGDIRETLRTVFASPEFNSPDSYRAKIKTPFELAVSAIRTLGGETNGGPGLHQWIAKMGEPLYGYQAPTGYPDKAENWVNTGALLERLNFGLALASNRIPGTRVDLSRFTGDGARGSVETAKVMDRFLEVIVQGDISPQTKATLLKQLSEPMPVPVASRPEMNVDDERDAIALPAGGRRRREQREMARADLASVSNPELVKVVGLILGSPEFQRQ